MRMEFDCGKDLCKIKGVFGKWNIAVLNTIESAEELEFFWLNMFNCEGKAEQRCDLLKAVMGGKYFDLPDDWDAQYAVLKAMFLTFDWKDAQKIDTLKEIVNGMF